MRERISLHAGIHRASNAPLFSGITAVVRALRAIAVCRAGLTRASASCVRVRIRAMLILFRWRRYAGLKTAAHLDRATLRKRAHARAGRRKGWVGDRRDVEEFVELEDTTRDRAVAVIRPLIALAGECEAGAGDVFRRMETIRSRANCVSGGSIS